VDLAQLKGATPAPSRRNGHNRVRPSTLVYRTFVAALDQRRLELGLPMAQVDDIAGLQDGFFAKLAAPDTPHGRQSRWESVDLVVQALFGTNYRIQIIPENFRAPARLETRAKPRAKILNVKHWRHRKLFQDLGRKGAQALNSLPRERRSEIAKKTAATRRQKQLAASPAAEESNC
jgi:hypothetical protein